MAHWPEVASGREFRGDCGFPPVLPSMAVPDRGHLEGRPPEAAGQAHPAVGAPAADDRGARRLQA
eukprot:14862912-Alexandrium_andersonii.AAC.1